MKTVSQTNIPATKGNDTANSVKSRRAYFQKCKFCGENVNLNEEGETYRDGSAAHEGCADADTFERENASDIRD